MQNAQPRPVAEAFVDLNKFHAGSYTRKTIYTEMQMFNVRAGALQSARIGA